MEPPRPEINKKYDSRTQAKFDNEFESVEKSAKITKKVINRKLNFFRMSFYQLFQRIQNQHQILRFLIPILHL
jgi:hypothetical protein